MRSRALDIFSTTTILLGLAYGLGKALQTAYEWSSDEVEDEGYELSFDRPRPHHLLLLNEAWNKAIEISASSFNESSDEMNEQPLSITPTMRPRGSILKTPSRGKNSPTTRKVSFADEPIILNGSKTP